MLMQRRSLAMRYFTSIALVLATSLTLGCTKTDSSTGEAAAQPGQPQATQQGQQRATAPAQPIAVAANATPDQVVTVFLNAMRSGDSPTTESLLTGKAREELAKHSLSVDVQSAPNATYQ